MRNEMVGAVVRRAIEHPSFRDQLMENPEQALSEHGFALEQEDLKEIEGVRSELRGDGNGDVEQKLIAIAERYGIEPEGDRPIPEQK
jgi:hypothetical protein